MACTGEKATAGVGIFGVIGNIAFAIWKGKPGFSIATPIGVLAAILRGLAAAQNLEDCLALEGVDVTALRAKREQLQREVEQLQRLVPQNP